MDWFHLVWIIVSAVYVSCQELKISLPKGSDACERNVVTFTCTIRGSPNLTSLILAWSSPEYIGNPLRFVSEDTPGANATSDVNENVNAILISNTMIGGVPELVSELRIVGANQTSIITCESVTNQSSVNTKISIPAFPGRPQRGEARERTPGSCDFLVAWDPPSNSDISDIGSYRVYVPSQKILNVSSSNTIDLYIPNCGIGNNSIQVAAVNRLGCVGPNSTFIQLTLLEIPPSTNRLSTSAVAGIAVVVAVFGIVLIIAVNIFFAVVLHKATKHKYKNDKENFENKLKNLIQAIRETDSSKPVSSTPLVPTLARDSLELMNKMPPSDIKEVLKTVLDTKVTSANSIKAVLQQSVISPVISIFNTQLGQIHASITMDSFNDSTEDQKHRDELLKHVNSASPEKVKENLQKLFETLRKEAAPEAPALMEVHANGKEDGGATVKEDTVQKCTKL